MSQFVKVIIDGITHRSRSGQSLLAACKHAGRRLPTLCHLPGHSERGACRLCLVRLDGRVVSACSTPVVDGQVVVTQDRELSELRRTVIELTLLEHGCCDDPRCAVEALAREYDVPVRPRLEAGKKASPPASDYMVAHVEHCVHCDRCVRSCERQLIQRAGDRREVSFAFLSEPTRALACTHCGNCVAVCPAHVLRVRTR